MGSAQRTFVLDVVSGCIEHHKLIDIVVSVFCRQSGKYFIRDRTKFFGKSVWFSMMMVMMMKIKNIFFVLFLVICYLIIFAHDDLELDCFGNIVTSLGIKKMDTVRIVSK